MTDNVHTAYAIFTFKDSLSRRKFIEFCNGSNGLSVTRGYDGCKSIECYENQENPLTLMIWQKWESKSHHEAYVKFRHDDGSFAFLGDLVAAPPDINGLSPLEMTSDEEQIKQVIVDMCDKDYKVGMKHMADDCVFVRPSGNPLDNNGWEKMMSNDDVKVESSELISINKLRINGDMAYVCYTTHGKFNYKGTANDDIAVMTSVLERVNGKWVVSYGQRSTGRSPGEGVPAF
jgi:ketosteroid isomerase-like protein/quinol monooxygenase YgiN